MKVINDGCAAVMLQLCQCVRPKGELFIGFEKGGILKGSLEVLAHDQGDADGRGLGLQRVDLCF